MRSTAKRLATAAAVAALSVSLLTGCSASSLAAHASTAPRAAGPSASTPATATSAFGLDLMRELGPGNVVLSPISVAEALAMAGSGARGRTAQQIATALHLRSPAAFDAVGELARSLLSGQHAGGGANAPQLALADGLFVQSGFAAAPPFLEGLRAHFGASPQQVDFAHDAAGAERTINVWVSEQTHGLIGQIVSNVSEASRLVLANAIYVKAQWAHTFRRQATSTASFRTPTTTVRAQFMHETTTLDYGSGAGYDVVELPYADSTLELAVLLPTRQSIGRLIARTSASSLQAILSRTRPRPVELALPRFSLARRESLDGPLHALGVTDAFSQTANFTGISAQPLRVSSVQHAADFSIDEEGTLAAAATTVEVEATAIELPREAPIHFDADRPFLFFLRDGHTGAVLFAGELADPTA